MLEFLSLIFISTPFIILLIIIIIVYILIYNSFVRLKKDVEESFSGIDVQLKRRYDLIPNLINVVKAYAQHENRLFQEIAKIRQSAMQIDAANLNQKSVLETELSSAVHNLLLVSENYPNLKANQNFLKLQEELTETEDQIAASRRIYNSNTQEYNTKVDQFPSNIIAKLHKFHKIAFFQAKNDERTNPKVNYIGNINQ